MPGVTRYLVTFGLLCLQTGSGAVTVTILEPIRSFGDEVGLIFVPEAHLSGDQYNTTARAIQEASHLRVWVAFTDNYFFGLVTEPELHRGVQQAIEEFKKAGMTSKSYVGVGHGWGGIFLQDYAKQSDLKAIVLMGATVSRKTQLRDYPVAVLTLAAELDGVTRITRVVQEYEKLTKDMATFYRGLYRTPVIFIEGANHAQFGAGTMWSEIDKGKDLKPEIMDEEAHGVIGKYINDFLTVKFSSLEDQVDEALNRLLEPFLESAKKFQPFLDIRNLDTDGEESMWTVLAQMVFAGEYRDRVAISNKIAENPWFFGKQPSISLNHGNVVVATTALVTAKIYSDSLQMRTDKESPLEVNMKLVAKEALWQALSGQNDTALRSEPNTCASLNKYALFLALTLSTEHARERYFSVGRPIIVEEDAMRGANFLWAPSPLQTWEDKDGLHVRSIAMATPKEHYCKVLSTYRAMEWVNIDSLRVYP